MSFTKTDNTVCEVWYWDAQLNLGHVEFEAAAGGIWVFIVYGLLQGGIMDYTLSAKHNMMP